MSTYKERRAKSFGYKREIIGTDMLNNLSRDHMYLFFFTYVSMFVYDSSVFHSGFRQTTFSRVQISRIQILLKIINNLL